MKDYSIMRPATLVSNFQGSVTALAVGLGF